MLENQFDVPYPRYLQARQIQVSTDDGEVKAHLRQLGEPICKYDYLQLDLSILSICGISEIGCQIKLQNLQSAGSEQNCSCLMFLAVRRGKITKYMIISVNYVIAQFHHWSYILIGTQ